MDYRDDYDDEYYDRNLKSRFRLNRGKFDDFKQLPPGKLSFWEKIMYSKYYQSLFGNPFLDRFKLKFKRWLRSSLLDDEEEKRRFRERRRHEEFEKRSREDGYFSTAYNQFIFSFRNMMKDSKRGDYSGRFNPLNRVISSRIKRNLVYYGSIVFMFIVLFKSLPLIFANMITGKGSGQ